jgi:hypothetical protein
MASLFYGRLAWLSAFKGATAAAVTCWIMGFGWPATLVLVSIGFISAAFFARRKVAQQGLAVSHDTLYAAPTSGSLDTSRTSARYEIFPNYRESRPRFARFWEWFPVRCRSVRFRNLRSGLSRRR